MEETDRSAGENVISADASQEQRVYLVEFRQRAYADLDDCTVAHVASSKERALAWCQDNLDYDSRERAWYFALIEEKVDHPAVISGTRFLGWVGWDGLVDYEAAPGYYLDERAPERATSGEVAETRSFLLPRVESSPLGPDDERRVEPLA